MDYTNPRARTLWPTSSVSKNIASSSHLVPIIYRKVPPSLWGPGHPGLSQRERWPIFAFFLPISSRAHMAKEPKFRDDFYDIRNLKCIVFPAEGSEPRIVDMTIRTVIQGDISNVSIYNRTVDLLGVYGSEYRKLRVQDLSLSERPAIPYLLYYNMSPKLPLNSCIARIIGVDPNKLGSELFWRGDVVGMKFEPESEYSPIIQCYDADASAIVALGNALVDDYGKGKLERELSLDEGEWKSYCSDYRHWGTTLSAMATGHHPYWGKTDWRTAEAGFLNDINELREFTGRSPILIDPGLFGMVSGIILQPFQPFFSASHRITGTPAFPPELERRIFETCVRSSPASCSNLVLVARRVRDWIDPILYETIILDNRPSKEESESSIPAIKATFEQFVANLDRKPPEFYSKHVKNLWVSAPVDPVPFLRILTLCSGIENLVLFPWRHSIYHPFIPFQEHLNPNSSLRRLTLKLEHLFPPFSTGQHFNYPFFANITHLHLYDESEEWSAYTGFEHLRSLTHLAFACCGPDHLGIVMPKLPAIEYVALCSYKTTYGRPVVDRRVPVEVYGIKVVFLDGLTKRDWECGTTGRADFWDIVEKEVTRRRTGRYVGMI